MKNFMNFRPFVIFALSFVIGILSATYLFVSLNLKLIYFVLFSEIFVAFVVLFAIFRRKFLIFVSVCILFITIPIGRLYFKQKEVEYNQRFNEKVVVINGRICENYGFSSSGNLKLKLDNINIVGADFKEELDGNIVIYSNPDNYDVSKLEIGRFVSFFGTLKMNKFETGSDFSFYNLSHNIIGSCYASYSSFELKDKINTTFDEKVRNAVYQKINSFDLEYSDIGYAMMFGDESNIDDIVVNSFRTTGIAHLLAVSGLHVSILIMIISFVLKLLKASPKTRLTIIFCLLLIYCYLCDFSVSVLRASIMSVILLYLKMKGKCYDALSAMAFSICILLLINPLNLFKVSFLLSYFAVFSITIFAQTLNFVFDKVFHKKLSNTLALNLSVQAGLIFIQLYFFEKYSILSIVCNLLSIPIATVAFTVFIAGFVISLIFPFMSFVCGGYDYLMGLVVKLNYTISKIRLTLTINSLNFATIIFGVFILLVISNYVFLKKRYKAIGVSLFALISSILLFVWL